jgi:YD repeat-containing protein
MVAIVTGNGLGLSTGSLGLLGASGQVGAALFGRGNEGVYVNAATGNLVLRRQDELLIGRGPDTGLLRSYNSQGTFNDENGDNWRLGFARKITGLTGTVNTANSTIVRIDDDGSEVRYSYSGGVYVSKEGGGAFDTLSYNATTQKWTWTDGDSRITETYESHAGTGRLLSVADIDGNTLNLGYTGSLLTSIMDASGQSTYIKYYTEAGRTNNIKEIRTLNAISGEVRTSYEYDTSNRLTKVTTDLTPADATDNGVAGRTYSTTYTYEGTSKRIASIAQSDGSRLEFVYTEVPAGTYRVRQVKDVRSAGDIRITEFTYDTALLKTTVKDPLNQITELSYYADGQLKAVKAPPVGGVSQEIAFTYDAEGNLATAKDARNQTTAYSYDAKGNWVLERDSMGNTVTRTYSADNKLLTETRYVVPDPDQAAAGLPSVPLTTRYAYDAKGHMRYSISAEGRVTEYVYGTGTDGANLLAKISYTGSLYPLSGLAAAQDLSESQLNSWRDALDRRLALRIDYGYDFRGQLSSQTTYGELQSNGLGVAATAQITHYVYSQAGELLQVIDPRGVATAVANDFVTTYSYDGLGRQLSMRDAAGVLTVTSYDDAGRSTRVTLANGQTTLTTYDAGDMAVGITHGNGLAVLGTSTYSYDKLNRLRMTTDPTGVKRFHLYDEAGRLVGEIDGTGALIEHRYNANNQRVWSIAYANRVAASVLTTAAANPADFTLALARSGGFTVDAANDRRSYNIYNAAGQLAKTVDGMGAIVEYSYDGAGRQTQVRRYATVLTPAQLTTLSTAAGTRELLPTDVAPTASATTDRIERFFYDSDGRLRGKLDAEGYLQEYRYDTAGRLFQTIAYAGATPAAQRASGALASLIPAANTADQNSYTLYDLRGRVEGLIDAEGYLTEYRYDAAGNKSEVLRYANAVSYSAGATVTALRSAAGAAQVLLYQYNALDQLVRETDIDGTITDNAYDSLGRRTSSTRGIDTDEARTKRVQYDQYGRLWKELDGIGGAALATLPPGATQAQIDAVWAQYATVHTYDSADRRTSSKDALGNKTLFYYDENGRLTHTINAAGEVRAISYNRFGQIESTRTYTERINNAATLAALNGGLNTDAVLNAALSVLQRPTDNTQSLLYTRRGELSSQTDALGFDTAFTYTAFGELFNRNSRLNGANARRVDTHSYDRRGLLLTRSEDQRVNTRYEYDASGRLIEHFDGNNQQWSTRYDRLGRLTQAINPFRVDRVTTYDAFSRVLTQRDATGNTTTYSYNTQNRSVTVTTAENISITTVKNRHGETQSVTDGLGNTTSYQHDPNGRLKKVTAPPAASGEAARVSTTAYNAAGQITETTDANGTKVVYSYDAAGRVLTRTLDPGGLNLTTTYRYDRRGRNVWVQDANKVWTVTIFDATGRKTDVIVDHTRTPDWESGPNDNPEGLSLRTTYVYDGSAKLTVTEGAGSTNPKITEYHYDALGRLTKEIVDPGTGKLNITCLYAYDANGNMVAKTAASGTTAQAVTRYVYDTAGRLQYEVNAVGAVTLNYYDAEGRPTAKTAYANLISLTTPVALPDAATANDITARLNAASSSNITTRSIYDKDGRAVFDIDGTNALTERVYDKNGNVVKTIAYASRLGALASYDFASVRQAANSMSAEGNRISRNAFDRAGRLAFSIDALGYVTQYFYDPVGQLLCTNRFANALTGTLGDGQLPAVASGLPSNGQVLQDNARDWNTRSYYDKAGRLVLSVAPQYIDKAGVAGEGVSVTAYRYDALGREIQRIVYGDRILLQPADTLAVLQGRLPPNPTSKDFVQTKVYDSAGRLTRTTDPSNKHIDTVYDALGRAVKVTDQLGNAGHFYFDAAGRAVLHIDPEGYALKTTYDAHGRSIEIRRYATNTSGIYDQNTPISALGLQVDTVRDAITRIEHDAEGRQKRIVDAEGFSETITYDAFGNRKTYVNKLGGAYAYTYDARGRVLKETLPTSITTKNAAGQTITVVNEFSYDARGNLLKKTEAKGAVEERSTTFSYDLLNRVETQTGNSVEIFDPLTQTTRMDASREARRYDARGNLVEVNLNGARTLSYYDVRNRKIAELVQTGQVGENLGALATYTYDVPGNLLSETKQANAVALPASALDPRPNVAASALDRIVRYTYDKNGRQKTATMEKVNVGTALADVTSAKEYDGAGNLIRETDALGNSIYRYYDKLGRQRAQVDQENYLITWDYRAGEKAIKETRHANRLGLIPTVGTSVNELVLNVGASLEDRVAENVLDRMGRVVETRVLNVEYGIGDGNGGIARGGQAARTRYVYNGLGLLTKQEIDIGGSVTEITDWTYDSIGRKKSEIRPTYLDFSDPPDGVGDNTFVRPQTDYEYNGLNELKRETALARTAAENRITEYVYSLGGRLLTKVDASAVATHFDYDVQGRITRSRIDRRDVDGILYNDATYFSYDMQGREVQRSVWSRLGSAGQTHVFNAADGLETRSTRYNVFGEVTGKRVNNGGLDAFWQETAEYDNAGRAWKSNAGDGVYRVHIYDRNGNAIASVKSTTADFSALRFDQLTQPGLALRIDMSQYDRRNKLEATFEAPMTVSEERTSLAQFIEAQLQSFNQGSVESLAAPPMNHPTASGVVAISGVDFRETVTTRTQFGAFPNFSIVIDRKITFTIPNLNAYGSGNLRINIDFDNNQVANLNFYIAGNVRSYTTPVFTLHSAYKLTVLKLTPQGQVVLHSHRHGNAPDGATARPTSKDLVITGQPPGTKKVILRYRLIGSNAGWQVVDVPQMINLNGQLMSNWYAWDWAATPRGQYEYRFVALDEGGNTLNAQGGSLNLSDTTPSISQNTLSYGGLGDVFMDSNKDLFITQQPPSANSIKLKYRRIGEANWTQTILTPWTGVSKGWFAFNARSLSGAFEYTFEAYAGANGTGAIVNRASGTFNGGYPDSVSALSPPRILRFVNQPPTGAVLKVSYRPQGSTGSYAAVQLLPNSSGNGLYEWNIHGIPTGRYEYIYEVRDAGGVLLNKAHGIAQLGTTAVVESHSGVSADQIEFAVTNPAARQLALYYRVPGSNGPYLALTRLYRSSDEENFFWDPNSFLGTSQGLNIDYYYELHDAGGARLMMQEDPLVAGTLPIRVFGNLNLGAVSDSTQLKWLMAKSGNQAVTVARRQVYNAFGEVIQEGSLVANGVLDRVVEYRYNALGRLIEKKDPMVSETLESGFIRTIRPTTRYTYDLAGRLVEVKDPNGNENRQSWLAGTGIDSEGKVLVEFHADGGRVYRGYDKLGGLRYFLDRVSGSDVASPFARWTRYTYDQMGRLKTLLRPSGAVTENYFYDALGNRIKQVSDATDKSVASLLDRTYYDGLGRITKTITTGLSTTTYYYTYSDAIRGIGGARTGGYERHTQHARGHVSIERADLYGHVSWRRDLGGHVFTYEYNQAGWLTRQSSLAGNELPAGYAPWVNLAPNTTSPYTGQNIQYSFYENGNIKEIYDVALQTRTYYEYDLYGNRTREVYARRLRHAWGTWSNDWEYNQNALIQYDGLNRVTNITDVRSHIRYEYDANGNRRRVLASYNNALGGAVAWQDYWYLYDSMNRFKVTMGRLLENKRGESEADGVRIELGKTGVWLNYDAAGQRNQAVYGEDGHAEVYNYTADGYLTTTRKAKGVNSASGIEGAQLKLAAARRIDPFGRVVQYEEYDDAEVLKLTRKSYYNADSKLMTEDEWDGAVSGGPDRATIYDYYDRNGNANDNDGELKSIYQADKDADVPRLTRYYDYVFWDEAKELTVRADPHHQDISGWKDGDALYKYDANGNVRQIRDPAAQQAGLGRTINFITNAQGLILERNEIAGGTAGDDGLTTGGTVDKRHYFYYVNGQRVGDVGNDGPVMSRHSYAEQLAQSPPPPVRDRYKYWGPIASADFDQNFRPINRGYPVMSRTNYTVKTGETLQSIAAAVWGDAAMWYLLADANGLTGTEPLRVGQILTVPNKVTNIHNNAQTYRVYDPGEAMGDVTPTLPEPPPQKGDDGGCGGVAMIIMIVVIVIVTIVTMGTGTAPVAGAGAAATGAGGATIGSAGFSWATVGTGMLKGALISAGVQLGAMALGLQDKFSWSGVAMGAIGGGVSAGLGSMANAGGLMADIGSFGRGALGSAITQGIGVATGLQKKFDWRAVAAAGIGAELGEHLNDSIGQQQYGGNWPAVRSGHLAPNMSQEIGRGTIRGLASGGVQSLITGHRPNWGSIAVESFGSSLGDGIASEIARRDAMRSPQASTAYDYIDDSTVLTSAQMSQVMNAGTEPTWVVGGFHPAAQFGIPVPLFKKLFNTGESKWGTGGYEYIDDSTVLSDAQMVEVMNTRQGIKPLDQQRRSYVPLSRETELADAIWDALSNEKYQNSKSSGDSYATQALNWLSDMATIADTKAKFWGEETLYAPRQYAAGFAQMGIRVAHTLGDIGITTLGALDLEFRWEGAVGAWKFITNDPIDTTIEGIKGYWNGTTLGDKVIDASLTLAGVASGRAAATVPSKLPVVSRTTANKGGSVVLPETAPNINHLSPDSISPSKQAAFSYSEFGDVKPGIYYQAQRSGQRTPGEWFSEVKPINSLDAEELFNIKTWGNNAEQLGIFEIKPGLQALRGSVKGGTGTQLHIPREFHSEFVRPIGTEMLFTSEIKWVTRP